MSKTHTNNSKRKNTKIKRKRKTIFVNHVYSWEMGTETGRLYGMKLTLQAENTFSSFTCSQGWRLGIHVW